MLRVSAPCGFISKPDAITASAESSTFHFETLGFKPKPWSGRLWAMPTASENVVAMLRARVSTADECQRLADHLRVSRATVYNYRTGKRGLDANQIVAVAVYLGVSTDELLGLETPVSDPTAINRQWAASARALEEAERTARHLEDAAHELRSSLLSLTVEVREARAAQSARHAMPSRLPARAQDRQRVARQSRRQ